MCSGLKKKLGVGECKPRQKTMVNSNTVNVVIFAGGKFRENVGKTFHVGVIFTIFHLFPS